MILDSGLLFWATLYMQFMKLIDIIIRQTNTRKYEIKIVGENCTFRVMCSQSRRFASRANWKTSNWTRWTSRCVWNASCPRTARRWSGTRTARRSGRTLSATYRTKADCTDSSSGRRPPKTSEHIVPTFSISALPPSSPSKVVTRT